tara:strand:- start:1176 stop:3908 length:2733 start_codon:yes stop_codon:yes gene_type:complete
MNISKNEFKKLNALLNNFKKSKETELEATIWGDKFNNNILHSNFMAVVNYYTMTLGLEYTREYVLNIKTASSNIRTSVTGLNNIKMYWLKNTLTSGTFIRKRKKDMIDLSDYGIRFNFNDEQTVDPKSKNINNSRLLDENEIKYYRFKDIISVRVGDFRLDLSSVKQCQGKSFNDSGCLKQHNTYEIEVELLNKESDDLNKFLEITGTIVALLQGGISILSFTESQNVLSRYYKLIGIKSNNSFNKFISANPVSLSKVNLIKTPSIVNILKNYAVTYKADGQKHFLFYIDNKSYLIDTNLNIKGVDIIFYNTNNTLIEGEYISDKNLFLMYDILFHNGEDVRKRHLNLPSKEKIKKDRQLSRIELIQSLYKNSEQTDLTIEVKPYKYGNNEKIFEEAKKLWDDRTELKYYVDGLIFTPITEHYPPRGGTWKYLFKWKPSELNSIDFLVRFNKDMNGKDIVTPLFTSDENSEKTVKNYKTLTLFVGKNDDKFNKETKKWIKKLIASEFNPNDDDKNSIAKLFTSNNNKIYTSDILTGETDEIKDDTIVEFAYDKYADEDFRWKPIRVRYDKTEKYKSGKPLFGNYEDVANDIWEKINDPVTEYMITTGDVPETSIKYYSNTNNKKFNSKNRSQLQMFHNQYIKSTLIESVSPGKNKKKFEGELLDLSCGKGGDLSKWRNANLKRIVGIDIDKPGLKYAMNYYKKFPRPKPSVYFAWGDSSKLIFPNYDTGIDDMSKLRLKEYIPDKYSFDIVSVQFSLHYFYKERDTIENLIQNIHDNLKKGGHFIGTCFDGKTVFEKLKTNPILEGKNGDNLIWSIQKDYKIRTFNDKKPIFDKKIKVYFKSIGHTHVEYLVNFEYFRKMCSKVGLKLVYVKPFSEIYDEMIASGNKKYNLTESEKEFSFLNIAFDFVKL